MKLSHMVTGQQNTLLAQSAEEQRRRRRISWIYFILGVVVCNAMFNVGLSAAALACASQSLLSPLVACQIMFNAILSPCLLGEPLTRGDIIGTALIILGCVISGIVAPKSEQHYSVQELVDNFHHTPFEIYLCVMAALVVVCFIGSRAPSLLVRRVCAPALPGAFVGNANIFAKGAAGLVEEGLKEHSAAFLGHPITYAICFFAAALPFAAIFFLNRALAQFDANLVVPTYISTLIVVSTVSGGIYFNELQQMSTADALGLAGGVALVVVGVCVQASRAPTPAEVAGPPGEDESSAQYPSYAAPPTGVDGVVADVLPLPGVRNSTNGHGHSTGVVAARASNSALDAPLLGAGGGYETSVAAQPASRMLACSVEAPAPQPNANGA